MKHKEQILNVILVLTALCCAGCKGEYSLRGKAFPSSDGKTYLVVDEKESADCLLVVDHKLWPYDVHVPGIVSPGDHDISCGGSLVVTVSTGTVFYFWSKTSVPSLDGKTYLVVDGKDPRACTMLIDGEVWPYKLNKPGKVSPGAHAFSCDSPIGFEISTGTVFHYDYWGP